jgi:serine/threonine-protein kinase PknG
MDGESCNRGGCTGTLEDGYCNVCGLAALKSSTGQNRQYTAARVSGTTSPTSPTSPSRTGRSSPVTTGTGSSPLTNRSKGSRRTSPTSGRSSRKQLGAGLVSIPELPSTEPEKAIMLEAKVPENKRFCANCNNQLKREKGFCSQCGQKFSFIPSLQPNDLVLDQYEVKGAIAYGGLGWIYLGFDKTLSRYVVLKGLLNTEDASSAAVAVAERQFLASVKHANIVGIYNFVKHGTEGFIVMEYVGGKTLKEIRKSRGPLPIAEAIAYIHRILSAFSYLHQLGLVYCDFKPDNAMVEGSDVKLIDMGGVRRIDDLSGDIYGTVGYSAPEAGEGPTAVSDLFTIGRTLAVLLTEIRGFSKEHQYTLPSPDEEPLFRKQESLYRFLLKSTAENPDDRFQSADEMADQLLGVLREVVAIETNTPRPASSSLFGGDMLAIAASNDFEPIVADYLQVPIPTLNASDPAFHAVLNAEAIALPIKRVENLKQVAQINPKSAEALLRLANALTDAAMYPEIEPVLTKVEAIDAWDWRVLWYRGRSQMAQGKFKDAQAAFDQVYFDLPGELAPKLAIALAAERAQRYPFAIEMYDLVSRTDPSYVAAAFGLGRCLLATGDRNGAVAALARVPQNSSLFVRSRVEIAKTSIDTKQSVPSIAELKDAERAIGTIAIEGIERYRLNKKVLETALGLLTSRSLAPTPSTSILGKPLEEIHLRQGLEQALRAMAHLSTGKEKIRLVDEANRIRPKTLF